jgi:CsoR family transcriptional regulator, copper-sensing transcriptional repressor
MLVYPPPWDGEEELMSAAKKKSAIGGPESSAANLPADLHADLDSRLARIQGHVAAIRRMLAAGDDCDSLLVQASAVRSALNGVLVSLMQGHLESCIVPSARSGNSDKALDGFRHALETVLKRS